MMEPETRTVTVSHCARCDGTHPIEFKLQDGFHEDDPEGYPWKGVCPVTGEVVWMKDTTDDKPE